ncbi:unnamed protein product [Clonostachys chloroleuca]|uniref:DRBM domain-containing protein n=1 Tax=Clonostachys chloroleuca TaxID=1926264 RepID=A0AA35M1J0_9HYPO|nr:unnamed protein product [Clonostachys chloroleuca]
MARTPAAPWDQLRRWIDQQEAWENKNGQAAKLNPRQLAAINELVSAVSEPDIGSENYLSLLNSELQAKQMSIHLHWQDEEVAQPGPEGNLNSILWRCVCTVQGHGKFPRAGHGYSHNQKPCFQNKKKAKQFAAKHALAAVRGTSASSSYNESSAGGPSPPLSRSSSMGNLSGAASPVPEAQEMRASSHAGLKRVKVEDAYDSTPAFTYENAGPSSSPSSRSEKDKENEKRILWLTGRLNLEHPEYKIEWDDSTQLFRGRLRLKPGYKGVDVGSVENMPNQLAAKKKLNELLLAWLEKENKERGETLDFINGRGFH